MPGVHTIYEDGSYAAQNPAFGDDDSAWKASNALAIIRDQGIPHESIIEVGCGGGAIIEQVSKELNCPRALGLEPMPEAFAAACARSSESLKFQNATIATPPKEKFDLVLCFDVFEHVEDYLGFLTSLREWGSNFLFHIPLDMNAQMVARGTPIHLGLPDNSGLPSAIHAHPPCPQFLPHRRRRRCRVPRRG